MWVMCEDFVMGVSVRVGRLSRYSAAAAQANTTTLSQAEIKCVARCMLQNRRCKFEDTID